jgi:hypothetical protein
VPFSPTAYISLNDSTAYGTESLGIVNGVKEVKQRQVIQRTKWHFLGQRESRVKSWKLRILPLSLLISGFWHVQPG